MYFACRSETKIPPSGPCLPNGMYFQFYSIGVECLPREMRSLFLRGGAYSSGVPFCLSKSNVDPVIGALLNSFVVLFNRGAAISKFI